MDKLNIVVLLLNQGRGSGEVARQHVRYLIELGHTVSLLHPKIGKGVDGAENVDIELHCDIIPVHEYLPSASGSQMQVAQMDFEEAIAYIPAYEAALEKVAPDADIIIGHHANLSAIAVHNVAKKHSLPYALFIHGTGIEPRHTGLFNYGVWALIEKAVLNASGIMVTTEYVRDSLVKPMIDLSDDKFLVLPCGVDLKEFHPDNTGGIVEKYDLSEPYVICPGALTESKGPQNVVKASEKYADIATTLLIGAGEMQDELEKDLGSRGRFLGYVSSEDKAKLINGATILTAAPEKKEHFGIIYAEAMAGGTVPVAYNGGGVPSIVTPEVGVLTERDPAKLGDAIASILKDDARRQEMAVAGRKRAEERFHYPTLVKQLEEWLYKLISK